MLHKTIATGTLVSVQSIGGMHLSDIPTNIYSDGFYTVQLKPVLHLFSLIVSQKDIFIDLVKA